MRKLLNSFACGVLHTFTAGITLVTEGNQMLTVQDSGSGITGSVTITVGPGP